MVWHEKLTSLFSHGPPIPKEEQVVLRVKRLRSLEEKARHGCAWQFGMT